MEPSLLPLTHEMLAAIEKDVDLADDDLLLTWMTPRAAVAVRRLAATINRASVQPGGAPDAVRLAEGMSSFSALCYLALFRVVRETLGPFAGTNPTWVKQQVKPADKVDVDLRTLRPALIRAMTDLAKAVKASGLQTAAPVRSTLPWPAPRRYR